MDTAKDSVLEPVRVGQVWRDNYDYKGAGYVRYVKIINVDGERVLVHGCGEDGFEDCDKPNRWNNIKRFNGKRGGYSLVTR